MAIYDTGTASLAANGRVNGVGTQWTMPLTLIRVGATVIFKTNPIKIYTISEITSDTSLAVYNPNGETVPAGTGYAILAHDGISVQGLAQDVAETLRYYQSKETSIQSLIDFIGQDSFDWPRFEQLANQSVTGAAEALASQISAADSAATAVSARNTTTAARDATIAAINGAGDASTLVTLAGWGIGLSGGTPNTSSMDFQNFNFVIGANYRASYSSAINIPTGLVLPSSATMVINVTGGGGANNRNMDITTYTIADNNFRKYSVTYNGEPGSREFYVRESIYLPGGNEVGGASAQRVRGLLDVYSKSETFEKSMNLSDVANKATARTNLDVYSKSEISKMYSNSIISFGAVGDGVNDDTQAIQAAIDATPYGGKLIIPNATSFYKITSELVINKSITIEGFGGSCVHRSQMPCIKAFGPINAFKLIPTDAGYLFGYGVTGVKFSNIMIEGQSNDSRSNFGICCDETINGGDYHVRECDFSNVHIRYFDTGIRLLGIVYLNSFYSTHVLWCGTGCNIDKVEGAAEGNSDQNRFFGCEFVLNNIGMILSNRAYHGSQTIYGCTISENTTLGVIFGYNTIVHISGSQIEANGIGVNITIPSTVTNPNVEGGKLIIGNWFLSNNYDIWVSKETASFTGGFAFPLSVQSNTFSGTKQMVLYVNAPTGAAEFDSRQFIFGSSNSYSGASGVIGLVPDSMVSSGWRGYNGFKEDGKVSTSYRSIGTALTNVGFFTIPSGKRCYIRYKCITLPQTAADGRNRTPASIEFINVTGAPTSIHNGSNVTSGEFAIERTASDMYVSINTSASADNLAAISTVEYCIL